MSLTPAFAAPSDTIVAQSTAPGAAAIAIVRLAGPQAQSIAQTLSDGDLAAPYHMALRRLQDETGDTLDEALVVRMPGPHSYTGDDVVELHLHGSVAVVAAVEAACRRLGARAAEAGEFTRRAFCNGRLSLPEVEAVSGLIHAESQQARRAALSLLAGGLRAALAPLLEPLTQWVAHARAALDFPDDAGSAWPPADLPLRLEALGAKVQALREARDAVGEARAELVLLGPSNAGKSTLLNLLVAQERALVDAAPGTTRDAISASFSMLGRRATVWDTAGLNEAACGVEARGIDKGLKLAEDAFLTAWLLGPRVAWPPANQPLGRALWVIGSHADGFDAGARARVEAEAARRQLHFAGWLSAPTGEGLPALRARLQAAFAGDDKASARVAMTARHAEALGRAQAALAEAVDACHSGVPDDVLLGELERALGALDAVAGTNVEAAVFERIFSEFCIGK